MLEIKKTSPRSEQESVLGAPEDELTAAENLRQILFPVVSIVRRQFLVSLVVIPCAISLELLYLLTTPPEYTAVAEMVIDTHKGPAFQQPQMIAEAQVDAVAVATQVEVLTSENVSLKVISDLKLTEDPEFAGPGHGFTAAISNLIFGNFRSGTVQSASQLQRRALDAFNARLKVTRVPQTYEWRFRFGLLILPRRHRSLTQLATPISLIN
jgi:polysaccharide biosynthesis transport protein